MPLLSDLAQNPLARPRRPQTYEELERVRHTLPEAEVEAIANEIEARTRSGNQHVLDVIEGRAPRPGLEEAAGLGALQGLLENRPRGPELPSLPPAFTPSARESLDRMDWAKTHTDPSLVIRPQPAENAPGNVAFAEKAYDGRPKDRFDSSSPRQRAEVDSQLDDKLRKFQEIMAKERDARVEKERELRRTEAMRTMAEGPGRFRPSLAADYLLTGGPPQPTGFVAENLRVKEAEQADALQGMGLASALRQAGFNVPEGMTASQLGAVFPHLARAQLAQEQMALDLALTQAAEQAKAEAAAAPKPLSDRQTEALINYNYAIERVEDLIGKKERG